MRCWNQFLRLALVASLASFFLASPFAMAKDDEHTLRYWDRILDSWKGKPAIDLWRDWGVPSKIVKAPNNNEMHLYFGILPKPYETTQAKPGDEINLTRRKPRFSGCETTFEVNEDKRIVGSHWRGGECPQDETEEIPYWTSIVIGF